MEEGACKENMLSSSQGGGSAAAVSAASPHPWTLPAASSLS